MLAFHLATFDLHPLLDGDDYVAYLANARALAAHTTYGMPGFILNTDYTGGADLGQAVYPVGLPLLLLPIAAWAGDNITALLHGFALLNCLLLALSAGGVARLAQQMASPRAGWVAGLAVGFSPFLFDQGAFRTPSEPAFLTMLVITLLLDQRLAATGRGRNAAWVGAAAAATGMVRVVGILVIPAVVLAEFIRRRRVTKAVIVLAVVAGILMVLGLLAMGQDYLTRQIAIYASSQPASAAVGSTGPGLLARLQQNLFALPGNLTVLWAYGWGNGVALANPQLHRALQAISLLTLAGAGAGFIICWRRGHYATAVFVLLQCLLLVVLPAPQQSPRYYLPVSILLPIYLLAASEAGKRWRHARFGLATLSLLVSAALIWPDALAARADNRAFNILEPRAAEMAAWVRANSPADAVLLAHRPRTLVLLTDRAASDFTSASADARFAALASNTHARWLIMSIDTPALRERAAAQGLPSSDDTLNRQLDDWEAAFFSAPPPISFHNSRFRVYALGG